MIADRIRAFGLVLMAWLALSAIAGAGQIGGGGVPLPVDGLSPPDPYLLPGGNVIQEPSYTGTGDTGCELGTCCPCTAWTVTAGAIFLHRSQPYDAPFIESAETGAEVFQMQDLNLGWGAGPRVSVARTWGVWDIEFLYFGTPSSYRTSVVPDDPAGHLTVLDITRFASFTQVDVNYTTQMHSFEANVKVAVCDRVKLLSGFRTFQLNELLSVGLTGFTANGTTDVRANNQLYGYQIGAEGRLLGVDSPFHLDGFVKTGIYGSYIHDSAFSTGDMVQPPAFDETHTRASFVGELGITASYQFTPHLSAFGGYEVLWAEGVSLAPGALVQADRARGSALYHGAMAGIELRW